MFLNVQTVSQVGSLLEFNHVPTQSSPPSRNPYHISSKKTPPSLSVLGFASEKSAEISRAMQCIMYYTKNYIENIQ